MRDIGVELGQGFLIARPLPARAVPIWRNDWDARRPYPAAEGSAGP
jgi:EAL domain-containing protein (putative c-di-GMP-specific phosphodiesterase class I)